MLYKSNACMIKLRSILYVLVVMLVAMVSCDEYDTNVMGEKFFPYNSLVTKFRQLVYVEYKDGKARVWGPYAEKVEYDVDGSHVSIKSDLDSLVVFAFGYAMSDSVNSFEGDLSVNSARPYALYLGNLSLESESGTAIKSTGVSDCYIVLPDKSKNQLKGALNVAGALILDGKGALDIKTGQNTALVASGGLTCSYNVSISIASESGNGVHVENSDLKIADGNWTIKAGNDAISNASGSVILNGGKIYGHSKNGSFVMSPIDKGLVAHHTSCIAVSARASVLAEEARQFIWQAQVDTLSLQADSTFTINRTPSTSKTEKEFAKFTPAFDYKTPWVLISDSTLIETDWVTFQ